MIFQIKVDGQSFIPTHMQTCDATVMAKFNASAVFRYAVIIRWVLLLSDILSNISWDVKKKLI